MNKWKEIWNRREADFSLLQEDDPKQIFLELKRIDGFDVAEEGISFDSFWDQYQEVKQQLAVSAGMSLFEVGCGCGANLYLFYKDGIRVGGLDYSETLIDIMKRFFPKQALEEIVCDEAIHLSDDKHYDAMLADSVFSYFPDFDYAEKVLERMVEKAKKRIAILDIHDTDKEKEFLLYRKATIANYDERYRNLPKLFYPKVFFRSFGKKHQLGVKFFSPVMKDYWNTPFVYHCVFFKQ